LLDKGLNSLLDNASSLEVKELELNGRKGVLFLDTSLEERSS
jgi:hypothetical protein